MNEVLHLLNRTLSLDSSYLLLRSVPPSGLSRHTVTADASFVHSGGGALTVSPYLRTVSLHGRSSLRCVQLTVDKVGTRDEILTTLWDGIIAVHI